MVDLSWAAVAWLLGLVLASRWSAPPVLLLGVAVACGLAAWRGRARSADGAAVFAVLVACCALGALRQAMAQPRLPPDHVSLLNDGPEVTVRGRIAAEPDRRDTLTQYKVAVDAVRLGGSWSPRQGVVLVHAASYPTHEYGELVTFAATLETPPKFEDFDYRYWLAVRGVHSVARGVTLHGLACCGGSQVRRTLIALRNRGRRALAAALPEPEASLATGIVLGDERGIPERVDQAFRATNTTHVIAISGSNVALVLGVVTSALSRAVGRRRAVPPAVVALALYTALVGADAAVVRAAIMGGIMLVGHYLGRPGQAVRALLAAAWLMTAYRPGYLQDLGFQLSFAATVGLVLLSPPLNSAVEAIMARVSGGRPAAALPAALRESVLVTMAAQLATWPVIARQVGQVSLAGLVANFLIVPAQSAVMILGSATALLGGVWSPLGRVPGALAWVPLAYTIRVVEASARLPLASVQSTAPDIGLAAYYLALAGLLTLGSRGLAAARGVMRRAASVLTRLPAVHLSGARWPLSAAAVVCVLAWSAALTQPDGLLHLHVLDVGQGDSLYVVTPSGRRMLVDGGPSPSAVLDGLGRAMAPWDRRLDVVVLTHPDLDHVCGLPSVLGRYRVAQVVEAATEAQSPEALAWREAVAAEGANRTVASVGTTILLDNRAGVRATVLWPPAEGPTVGADNVNNHSVVLRLDHGAVRMLLTGDIEEPVESALVASGADLRSAVLKVPHHGSDTSSSPGFLDAVAPWLAVISVGAGNSFGHPSPKVMARLGWLTVRRTDKNGPIDVISDGTGVWVK